MHHFLKRKNLLIFLSKAQKVSDFCQKNEKSNLITSKWTKLEYPELEKDDIYIKEIKEDEAIAYFIRFSNNDILHIYEYVDGLENWFLDFEIVSPKNENYNEIITHMNETWVKRLLSY